MPASGNSAAFLLIKAQPSLQRLAPTPSPNPGGAGPTWADVLARLQNLYATTGPETGGPEAGLSGSAGPEAGLPNPEAGPSPVPAVEERCAEEEEGISAEAREVSVFFS